jgi:hypothetical protein
MLQAVSRRGKEGLSQSSVVDVATDAAAFLWLATISACWQRSLRSRYFILIQYQFIGNTGCPEKSQRTALDITPC